MNTALRFKFEKNLSSTLQGDILISRDLKKDTLVIVKRAQRHLLKKKLSKTGIPVPEDFTRERKILKYLTEKPDSHEYNFVKYITEWDDKVYSYLVMEKLHLCLFHVIKDIHTKGKMKYFAKSQSNKEQKLSKLESEYSIFIKSIFKQMIKTIWWLHQNNIVHLDISLENTMIKDSIGKEIKIIDFGLARDITNNETFKGCVGKTRYMSPECFNDCQFNGKSNDVYCLGICLYMMLAGSPLYREPTKSDPLFVGIIRGGLMKQLKKWKTLRLLTKDSFDLIHAILKPEHQRINMEGILDSKFVGLHEWRMEHIKQKEIIKKKKSGKKKKWSKRFKKKVKHIAKVAKKIF